MLYITVGLDESLATSTLVLAAVAGGYVIAALVSGSVGDRFGLARVITWCSVVYGLGLLAAGFATEWHTWYLALIFVVAIFGGAVMTLAWGLLFKLMPPDDRGAISGLATTTKGIGLIVGTLLAGILIDVLAPYLPSTQGYQVLWPVLAIPILLAIPLVFSLIQRRGTHRWLLDSRAVLRWRTRTEGERVTNRRTTTIVVGIVAAIMAISTGVAVAGGGLGSATEKQAFLNDVAKRLDVTPAELKAALAGAYAARIDAAVAAGKITKEHADAMKQRAKEGELPLLGGRGHGGFGQAITAGSGTCGQVADGDRDLPRAHGGGAAYRARVGQDAGRDREGGGQVGRGARGEAEGRDEGEARRCCQGWSADTGAGRRDAESDDGDARRHDRRQVRHPRPPRPGMGRPSAWWCSTVGPVRSGRLTRLARYGMFRGEASASPRNDARRRSSARSRCSSWSATTRTESPARTASMIARWARSAAAASPGSA